MSLDDELAKIKKEFGAGAIFTASDRPLEVEVLPTGLISLDQALGAGGLPRGRIVEIYGAESTAKTTLALTVVAQAQTSGLKCAFIDTEHALDLSYSQRAGVDVDTLLIAQPMTAEEALTIVEYLVESGEIGVVVIDSVAALTPRAELEGDAGDSHVGLQARLMSQAMRRLNGKIANAGTICIFINQIREKVGVYYGSNETTSGGRALKFYASVRIQTSRIESIKKGDEVVGSRHRARIVKNKVGPPFKQIEFDVSGSEGISVHGDLLEVAVDAGMVKKSGAWYSMGDDKMGQGKEAAKQYLKDNPDVVKMLRDTLEAQR